MTEETTTSWAPGVLLGRRLLVVEDNEDERLLLSHFLQQEGCRVYLAQDGQDALKKVVLVNPDLILMDVSMPVCDGLTACRALQQDPRTSTIPVVFLTGSAFPQDRVSGLMAGAVDYVTKPFLFDEVRLRLIVHLRARPSAGRNTPAAEGGTSALATLHTVLFRSACKQLLRDLSVTPNLALLAAAVGTNTKRLNEAFRKCVGVTVFEYLREERMREAGVLLRDTALEVQSIAQALGFSSGANFATAFKERFGLSPRDYRISRGEANAQPLSDLSMVPAIDLPGTRTGAMT